MKGIIVENLSSGTRRAISESNFNPDREKKIRDMKPGETVIGFVPRAKVKPGPQPVPTPAPDKPEGSPSGESKDTK